MATYEKELISLEKWDAFDATLDDYCLGRECKGCAFAMTTASNTMGTVCAVLDFHHRLVKASNEQRRKSCQRCNY